MTAFPEHTSAPSQPQARGETVLHDRRITVDGVETQYLEAGAGPPLLLLHGHEQGATSWRWVIPALARTHRVLALSLPGHGEAAPLPAHAPGADLAPFVAAFLVAVGAGAPLDLVGHSAGGASPCIWRWPTPPAPDADPRRQRGPGPRGAPAPGAGYPAGHRRAGRHDQPDARRRPGTHHHVRGHAVRTARADPGRVLHRAARAEPPGGQLEASTAMARALFGPYGQRQILTGRPPALTTPTLVVWGDRDYLLPVQQAHAAVKSLPHGRCRCSPTAGSARRPTPRPLRHRARHLAHRPPRPPAQHPVRPLAYRPLEGPAMTTSQARTA